MSNHDSCLRQIESLKEKLSQTKYLVSEMLGFLRGIGLQSNKKMGEKYLDLISRAEKVLGEK